MPTKFEDLLASGMSWSQAQEANRQQATQVYSGGNPALLSGVSLGGSMLPGKAVTGGANNWMAPLPTPTTTNVGTTPAYTFQPRQGVATQGRTDLGQGLTYEEAADQAAKTGGTVGWGVAQGYYVIPPTTTPSQSKFPSGTQDIYQQVYGVPNPYSWNTRGTTPGATTAKTPQQEVDEFLASQGLGGQGVTVQVGGTPPELVTVNGVQGYWSYTSDNMGNLVPKFNPVTPEQSTPYNIKPQPTPTDEGKTYKDEFGNTFQINYDYIPQTGGWDRNDVKIATAPEGMTEYQKQQLAFQQQEAERARQQSLLDEEYRRRQQQQQAEQSGATLAAQRDISNQQLAWQQQQQAAQLAAENQQRLATLSANPASWLEYAAQAGTTPVVQPWMLPLGYEQYGFKMGEPIPGVTSGNYANLPELRTPSAQYLARLSPSARAQYYSYLKARTGQTPEDIQSYLWSLAPSGGGGTRAISYMR